MHRARLLTPALAIVASLALAGSASAALKRVSSKNAFPIVAGGTLIWQAAGQGTTDSTGAFVWTVPADGSSPASVLFQGPPVPNEGVVGTDPSKTTPGQQPVGVAATPSFVFFQRQVGVFKTQQAGKNSPNFYTDFFPTATSNYAGALAGPLNPATLSADPGDPCPGGTVTEIPLGASGSTLVTIASCSAVTGTDPGRLLARTFSGGAFASPPVFLAGNGHSVGAVRVAGKYLAGIQSVQNSIQKSIVVIDITTGDVVNSIPKSPSGSFYSNLDVGTDGSVVVTLQRGSSTKLSVLRFPAGSTHGTTLPSSMGNIVSAPRIAGSRLVFLRKVSNGTQVITTNLSGGSVKGYGTLSSVVDPVNGFDAGNTWVAVNGTVSGKSGVYTTRISGS
jgi:hypothetical protein